jgi:hypothetical protein
MRHPAVDVEFEWSPPLSMPTVSEPTETPGRRERTLCELEKAARLAEKPSTFRFADEGWAWSSHDGGFLLRTD